jgi:hypothetical protein
MATNGKLHYSVYVVLLDDYIGTLPSIRLRNPKRDLSKPCVYIGLTPGRVSPQFDYRSATGEREWRVYQFGVRLMPELSEHLNGTTFETTRQTAKELAEDLRAKGYCVVNGICAEAQLYRSVGPQQKGCTH